MSYLVLARKYRPQTFEDVVGQTHITEILKAAIKNDRVGHAYLFCGPRGVGKTTCARILARELNAKTAAPTLEGMDLSSGMDVIEIDGASNNGVDEVRTLRENVQFVPMGGGRKVYIIDEVHMLSGPAFNALLKTLEEPPAHVVFVLATTDPGDLPLTVISRCQRFDFKRIPLELMVGQLQAVMAKEKIAADDDALYAIARASQGSMRDALSILDQVSASSSGKVTIKDIAAMLGLVETDKLFELVAALSQKDCSKALIIFDDVLSRGKDEHQFSSDLIQLYRDLMIMKAGENGEKEIEKLIDYSRSYKESLLVRSRAMTMPDILRGIDILIRAQDDARITGSSRLALEIAFARITAIASGAVAAPATPTPITASKPAVVSVAAPVKPQPVAPSQIINNNRGSITIGPALTPPKPAVDLPAASLDVEPIRRDWNILTSKVSQAKMSVGTCLQEGVPLGFEKGRLVIAFSPDNTFHKECLESMEHRKLVADIFSEHLQGMVALEYVIKTDLPKPAPVEALGDALESFGGEVINEWPTEK